MMDLRKRVFISISVVIGIILALALLILFINNREQSPEAPDIQNTSEQESLQGQVPAGQQPVRTGETTIVPVSQEVTEERYVRQLARIFVERFGTRSTHNENSHIDDVRSLVTPVMLSWIETQGENQERTYRGVTTRVISSSVTSIREETADVRIGVQEEIRTAGTTEMNQKEGRVELTKESGEWKVHGLYWD